MECIHMQARCTQIHQHPRKVQGETLSKEQDKKRIDCKQRCKCICLCPTKNERFRHHIFYEKKREEKNCKKYFYSSAIQHLLEFLKVTLGKQCGKNKSQLPSRPRMPRGCLGQSKARLRDEKISHRPNSKTHKCNGSRPSFQPRTLPKQC